MVATYVSQSSRYSDLFRPSIFDLKRGESGFTHGNYRATVYDKMVSTQSKSLRGKEHENDEDAMMSDLFICLVANKSLLSISSDYELTVGFHFFAKLLRSNDKCHEAMFGLARIHYI